MVPALLPLPLRGVVGGYREDGFGSDTGEYGCRAREGAHAGRRGAAALEALPEVGVPLERGLDGLRDDVGPTVLLSTYFAYWSTDWTSWAGSGGVACIGAPATGSRSLSGLSGWRRPGSESQF